MKCNELYINNGFDSSRMQNTIVVTYEPLIRKQLHSLLEDSSLIQTDEIVGDVITRLPEIRPECDIDVLVFDCIRKKLTKGFQSNICKPKSGNKLLCEYWVSIKNGSLDAYSFEELACILSCFSRKTFTYFINKYYFFDDSIPYSKRHERKIRKLFSGKGDVRPLYVWNRWKSHSPTPATYLFALNSLPDFFLNQISSEEDLIPHPEYDKYSVLTQRFLVRQKALPIILVMFIVSMLILYFQAVHG